MNLWIESYRWPLALLSGLLLVVGFAPFSFSVAGWIALVPAWWMITRSASVRKNPFLYGYLIGFIYFGGVFWWISNVTVAGVSFLIVYLAIYPAVWFWLLKRFLLGSDVVKPLPHFTGGALVGAALWVTLEWWRSWFLTGFDWNQLGVTQAPSLVFRQLASLGGVAFISFILVMVNILWAEGLLAMGESIRNHGLARPPLPLWGALLVVSVGFAYGWHHLRRHDQDKVLPHLTFACVQPNVPQVRYEGRPYAQIAKEEDAVLALQKELSLQAIPAQPDLLLWPECTVSQGVFQDRAMNETVMSLVHQYTGNFLLGSQDVAQGQYYNAAYLINPNHGDFSYQLYYKTYLVVWGEYIPLGNTFPIIRRWIGVGSDMARGVGPVLFQLKRPELKFTPLICFEDTVADVVDRAALLHPDFMVTITNDGWYQGACAQWGVQQHLDNAIFRTVEHDLPLIRCANNGISCEVNQDGTVVSAMQNEKGERIEVRGVLFRTLMAYPAHKTYYEIFGHGIILISEAITLIMGISFLYASFHRPCE